MVAIGPDGMPVDMGAIAQLLQELRIDNVVIADIMAALSDGVDRVEPLGDRSRRLHLRSMRGPNSSLFYTDNLLDELEHEVTVVERQKGYAPPTDTGLFSLRPGRRYVSLESRIAGLEALAQAEREDAPPPLQTFLPTHRRT